MTQKVTINISAQLHVKNKYMGYNKILQTGQWAMREKKF